MNRSDTIGELAAALAKAQGEIKGALKDQDNPFFKSKYADLGSVVEAIRAPASKNNLAYTQLTEPSDKDEVRVTTLMMHISGEWISSTLALPVTKSDAQGYGSALTYARRYGLSAAFGVAPEDDDGNAASKAAPPKIIAQNIIPDKEGEEMLKGCSTLDELADLWRSLTPEQRATLGPTKDECKAGLVSRDHERKTQLISSHDAR